MTTPPDAKGSMRVTCASVLSPPATVWTERSSAMT
jgi:hypothetical protein